MKERINAEIRLTDNGMFLVHVTREQVIAPDEPITVSASVGGAGVNAAARYAQELHAFQSFGEVVKYLARLWPAGA